MTTESIGREQADQVDQSQEHRDVQSAESQATSELSAAQQLARIDRELNDSGVPQEVWIGTDSTADRVSWLIVRNKLNQQNSRARFKAIEELADVLEISSETLEAIREKVLIAAGKRQHT